MSTPNVTEQLASGNASAPVSGSVAGPNSHECEVCGHRWDSIDDKTAKDVRKAAQVNGQGPYCGLCMHLEMAYRYAATRGFKSLNDAVNQWETLRTKPLNDKVSEVAGRKPENS